MGSSSSKVKKFLIFQEIELSSPNIKRFLIFSQKKAFLYVRKRKHQKNSLYFRKQNFLTFQEELPKPQKPKFLIFLQKKL